MRKNLRIAAAIVTVTAGVLAWPTAAFASCRLKVITSTLPSVTAGRIITVNPCWETSGTIQNAGTTTATQILIQLGLPYSASNQARVAFAGDTVTISEEFTDAAAVVLRLTTESEPAALYRTSLSVSQVVGGGTVTGVIGLTGQAPAGGYTVDLSSADTNVATVPAQVTVGAGQSQTSFTVTTKVVATEKAVNISGTASGVTKTATLPLVPPPLTILSVYTASRRVVGGNSVIGTVTLTAAAPSGGMTIALSSGNPMVATVPADVTIAAGATSATFTVQTRRVMAQIAVDISSSLAAGPAKIARLTVDPAMR